MSQKMIDIINNISRAAGEIGYDGAVTVDGEPLKMGMKREEGHPVYDSRTMDGFNIGISGQTLILSYHTDLTLKEVYNQDLESEIGRMMNKIIKELKNRYQANTGKSVGLTKQGELDVRVESSSRVRCWATARCEYKIGGLTGVVNIKEPSEDNIEKSFNDFLQLAAGKKRPNNDTRAS